MKMEIRFGMSQIAEQKEIHSEVLGVSEEQNKETKKGIIAQIKGRVEKISDKDLPKGLAVVFIIAVLALADDYIYFVYARQGGGGFEFFAIAFTFVAPIALWSIVTFVIHYVSVLLGGKGGMKRFFAMCGFAYFPIVIQKVLQIVVDLINITPAQSSAAEQDFLGLLLDHFNLFKILVLFLVAIAVMVNYGLNAKKAVIATLAPDIASIILSLVLFALNLGGIRVPFLGTAGRRLIRRL